MITKNHILKKGKKAFNAVFTDWCACYGLISGQTDFLGVKPFGYGGFKNGGLIC